VSQVEILLMKSNSILKVFYFITSIFLAYIVRKPVILCFHRVKAPSNSLLDRRVGVISPNNFRKAIRFMKIMGYEFFSLENLLSMIEIGKFRKVAVVTFDDGFKDLYQNAYPILLELNAPFTLFLTTMLIDSKKLLWLHKLYISLDRLPLKETESILISYSDGASNIEDMSIFIGKIIHSKNKKNIIELVAAVSSAARVDEEEERKLAADLYLSGEEIHEMKSNGLTVETHGHEHWPLTNLDEKETREEIKSSIRFIEDKLDSSPKYFALPSGTSNRFTKELVTKLGLKAIVTIERKIITKATVALYSLPRICVYDDILDFYRVFCKSCIKYMYLKSRRGLKTIMDRVGNA